MKQHHEIDLDILKPTTLLSEIERACEKARSEEKAVLCVPSLFVTKAKQLLNGSPVKVAATIAFPYGYVATEVKLSEILLAMLDGADELYISINTMAVKNQDWQYFAKEINHILPVISSKEKSMKMVVNPDLLTDDELDKCISLCEPAGVEVIQLSL